MYFDRDIGRLSPPPSPRAVSAKAGRKLFFFSKEREMFTGSSKGMEDRGPLKKIRITFLVWLKFLFFVPFGNL